MSEFQGSAIMDKVLTVETILEKLVTSTPIEAINYVKFSFLGGFSWFQLLATIIIISPEIPASMIAISPVLTGSTNIQYECETQNGLHKLSKQEICVFTNCTGPISTGPVPYISVVQEWELRCSRAWIVEMFTSIQMAGSMIGALLCAVLADRFGRKPVFFSLCFLMGSFGFAAGLANHIIVFALSKALAGFAVGGMYVVYLNYLMEFLTPSFRTICGCVSFWGVGEMLLALLGYLLPGWRELTWATSVPVFLILFTFLFLPESPRWLLCQGRTVEAIQVFNKIAVWNRKPPLDAVDIKTLKACSPSNKKVDGKSNPTTSLLKILKRSEYRNQMLIFMWAWFANAIVYYGLSFNTKNLSGDPILNVLYLGISDLPGSLSGMLFNNRFGRRRTFLGFSIVSASLLTFLAIARETYLIELYPFLTILLPLLGRFCTSANWAILACFTTESFPTISRASCIGACSLSANVGGILAPQLAFLGTIWSFGPYLVFCIITITSSIASLALKETTGKPLQDIIV